VEADLLITQKLDLMRNTKPLLLLAISMLIAFANVLQASDGQSFATFKAKSSEKFNPFHVTKALGGVTESNFAGSSFFFGDRADALWGGTANASGAPDGLVAVSRVFPNKKSRYLLTKDFGYNIPCNAVITDITFNVTRRNNKEIDGQDFEVRLLNPVTLDFSAENNADPSLWLEGGGFETVSYSSATWGETLTPEMLNDSRFGLVISVANVEGSGSVEAYVDAVEMVVCYDVTNPITSPITINVDKNDACFNQGSLQVNASGGSGTYMYSIDNGANYQTSNLFENLAFGDYIVTVQNADGTCQTQSFYCNLSGDDRILQAGDMVIACATALGSRVTLSIEKAQPFNDFYNQGLTGTDVSPFLPVHPFEWTVSDLGGEVFSVSIDQDRNIYTGVTTLYNIVPGANISPVISKIDAFTGNVSVLTTLPGNLGAAGVEYDTLCNQLFVANLEDGNIYRIDGATGTTLSTFDPLTPDDGAAGYPVLGERVLGVTYNYNDGRLYYSMWNSDFNMSGVKNTIRSVAIDPATCDFIPGTDQLELEQPWLAEYGDPSNSKMYNMPVGDITFSADGTQLLLAEVGYDSNNNSDRPHEARVLLYNGSSTSWTLSTNIPAGNTNLQHEIGEVSAGLNARGGVDFANAGFDADKCAIENEEFIVATGDALRGANCDTYGCIYGVQYLPTAGGRSSNSIILDIGRDFNDQLKSIFGDVDVVKGCQESIFCCPTVTSDAMDQTVCPGAAASTVIATTETDSLALIYHTTIPTDSIAIYANGIKIDTAATVGGSATLDFDNLPTTEGTYYVYIVAHPTPAGEYCRPNVPLVITVATPTTVEISGPDLVCVGGDVVTFTASPAPNGATTGSFTTDAANGLFDNGDGTANFDPFIATSGTYDVAYNYVNADGCPSSDTTSIVVDPCFEFDLSLAKSVTSTGPYMPGSTVSYDIVVTNDGDLEGIDIEVTDTPPTGLTLVSSSATTNPNITENATGVYTITSVPVSGSETISLSYTIDATFMGTSLINIAQITADNGDDIDSDPNSDENIDDLGDGIDDDDEDQVTVNVGQNYDLALTKNLISTGPFSPGDNVTFELTVFNEGSLIASGIEVLDIAPSGLIFVSDDSSTNPNVTGTVPGGFVIGTLSPTGNEVITVTYQIDPTFMGMTLDNVAEITIDDGDDIDSDPDSDIDTDDLGDGVADDDEDVATVMVGQVYDLSLTKTVISSGPYMQGANLTYLLTLSNDGTIDANNIEITDTPNAGLTFVSSNASANANVTETSPGVFVVTAVAAQTTETIEVTYQIASDFMGSSIGNNAQITADDGDDIDSDPDSDEDTDDLGDGIDDDDEDETTVNVGQVYDLSLTKTVTSSGPYMPGGNITYTLTLSNDGSIDANNIEITDTPAADLTFVSSNAATNANVTETSTGIWVVTALSSQTVETIEVTYQIASDFMGSSIGNNAQITADDGDDVDSDPDSDQDTDDLGDGIDDDDEDETTTSVGQVYDLSLTKTVIGTSNYALGDNVTYQITVSNDGSINANNIEVTDTPSSGLIYVSSNASGNANVTENSPGTWTVSAVAAMTEEVIEVTYQIDPNFTGSTLGNNAQITADDGDDVDSNPDSGPDADDLGDGIDDDDEDDAVVTIDNYDIALSKSVATAGPYNAGDNVTFDIVVTNEGSVDATSIEVSELPSTGFSYVSSSFSANVIENNQGVWTIASLPTTTSETISVTYQIDPLYTGTSIRNNVEISSDDGADIDSDPDSGPDVDDLGDGIDDDDEDEVSLDVVQVYDLSLTKTVTSNGPYGPGSTVAYSIAVSNDGTLPAANIQFSDMPTSSLILQSDDSGTNTNITDLSNGLYQIASLPAGTTETLNLVFQIDPNYSSGPIGNAGEITADDGDDKDSDPDSGPETDDFDDGEPDDDEDDTTIDVVVAGSIGDFVFEDTNGNGIQDTNESGFPNVRVKLYNINGFIVDQQFTNGSGNYLFEQVPAGNYYIEIVLPEGYANTFSNQGGDDTRDSDLDNSNGPGTTPIINLGSGENDLSIDLGINECIPIGDYVWFDYNQNDLVDPIENGINGIRVELYRSNGNSTYVLWDVTHTGHEPGSPSNDGYYKFCVSPGTYYVRFVNPPFQLVPVVPNLGNNENVDSDVTGMFGSGTTDNFTVVSGDKRCDIGAGFYAMGSIGDFVWLDNNNNGMRESNELGVEGVVVRAINDNGDEVASAVSDENGNYVLDYLTKSTMYLEFDSPNGYQFTQAHMGNDETLDSDVDNSNGRNTTDYFNINPGIHVPNIDAGLTYKVLAIEFSNVSGRHLNSHNLLEWSIQSDVDLSHYTIERSFGTINDFVEIGKVLSDTQDDETNAFYDYKDYDVIETGLYYYRIIQTDINGGTKKSKVISIEVGNAHSDRIVMYPNPVVEELVINVELDRTIENFNIQLFNRLGQLVRTNLLSVQNLKPGKNQFNVDVTDIPDGMYNVKVDMDNEIVFKKLIVLKQ